MLKHWIIAEPISEEDKMKHPDINPVILQLLYNRGHQTPDEIDVFLNPDWKRDHLDPWEFNHMEAAVDRVFAALEKGEVITIHGDYDADGVCGTTTLFTTLRDICRKGNFDEKKITYFIPHRELDGYGFNPPTIQKLQDNFGTGLVITVDCGISNKEAIDTAKEAGIDTIVCDHHSIPEVLPQTAILIHPQLEDESYANKHLCGTGVAYKLASGLIHGAQKRGIDFPQGYEKWLLDLVAIATVTDVMPLKGENRVLERFGLHVLNKTKRIGLQSLAEVADITIGALDTYSIGFQIGPRINAAGRMNHAKDALELLIEEDPYKAKELAVALNATNLERRKVSDKMYKEAKELVGDPKGELIIVYKEGWAPGIVGLVAGKLVRDFHLPVYTISQEGDHFVGSGRSIPGFNVTAALNHASDYLDRFGGHPEACGFSVTGKEKFEKAMEKFREYSKEIFPTIDLRPRIDVDADILLDDITFDLYEELMNLKPHGQGNPSPVFSSSALEITDQRVVGNGGKHLRLRLLSPKGASMNFIGFGFGDMIHEIGLGQKVDVVYHIDVNEWKGNRELQGRIEDIRLSKI